MQRRQHDSRAQPGEGQANRRPTADSRRILLVGFAHALGEREPRDKLALDQPTSGISRLVAQIDDTWAQRNEFFFHMALEKVEWLV